jgi:hypothetical protein
MKIGFKIASVTIALIGLTSCAPSESDKIADAQDCLDRSQPGDALACLEKVDGMVTPASDLIRCSAYFIDQGFSDPSRLSQVVEQLNGDSGGDTATIAILSFMAFSSSKYDLATNFRFSETAFGACERSKSKGLLYLSSMSRIATAAMNIIPGYDPTTGVPPTETEIRNAICTSPSSTTNIVIGTAAQTAYDQNCRGKDISKDPICTQYAEAVAAGTTPEEVGAGLGAAICNP